MYLETFLVFEIQLLDRLRGIQLVAVEHEEEGGGVGELALGAVVAYHLSDGGGLRFK